MSPLRTPCVVLLLLLLPACASLRVSADYDRTVDFTKYHAYAWAPNAGQRVAGHGVIDDPLLHTHIRQAVDREFAAAGFQKTDRGRADFLIDYDVTVEDRREVYSDYTYDPHYWYHGYPYGYYTRSTYVYTYREGTLILDCIDAHSGQVVWRGFAQAEVHQPADAEHRAERINDAVHKMLHQFPPGQAK